MVTLFYYVIDIVYIHEKKLIKFRNILVMLYVKSTCFFLSHVVFNLTMECTPREHVQ